MLCFLLQFGFDLVGRVDLLCLGFDMPSPYCFAGGFWAFDLSVILMSRHFVVDCCFEQWQLLLILGLFLFLLYGPAYLRPWILLSSCHESSFIPL